MLVEAGQDRDRVHSLSRCCATVCVSFDTTTTHNDRRSSHSQRLASDYQQDEVVIRRVDLTDGVVEAVRQRVERAKPAQEGRHSVRALSLHAARHDTKKDKCVLCERSAAFECVCMRMCLFMRSRSALH